MKIQWQWLTRLRVRTDDVCIPFPLFVATPTCINGYKLGKDEQNLLIHENQCLDINHWLTM